MRETTWIIDEATGQLTVEGLSASEVKDLTGNLLSQPQSVNCARPVTQPPLKITRKEQQRKTDEHILRVYRIYHHSVVEGPGRRSVIQLQGCTRYCKACYAEETFALDGGAEFSINEAVDLLLDGEGAPRDGVTILGGEPFLQTKGLAALVRELKKREVHITLYTGYTLEELWALKQKEVDEALALTNILIDGPFIVSMTKGAGEWRGSNNQRIIYNPSGATL